MKSNLHNYNNRTIHVLFEPFPTPGFIQYPSNQPYGHRAIKGRRSFVPRQINSDIITSQAATRWRPDNQWLQVAKKILTLRFEREGHCGEGPAVCVHCPGGMRIDTLHRPNSIFFFEKIFTYYIKNLKYCFYYSTDNGIMSFYGNLSKMYKLLLSVGKYLERLG